MLGQASGGWTESSSALRILHVGIRNTIGAVTDDSFTQRNPGAYPATNVSDQADTSKLGVLSGSVAFTRPDFGANYIGGPCDLTTLAAIGVVNFALGFKPLGVFINSANGNAFENTPAAASGHCPYVSGMGTYSNSLFETKVIVVSDGVAAGTALVYVPGVELVASVNGFLMPRKVVFGGAIKAIDTAASAATANTAEGYVAATLAGAGAVTGISNTIGILKMAADSQQNELVYDQRI